MGRKLAIRSAAWLLAGALALAVADNVRPWRRQQVEFLDLERRQLAAALAAARARPDGESAELEAAVIAAEEQVAGRIDDVVRLERELGELRAKLEEARRRRDGLRHRLEQARYRARRAARAPAGGGRPDPGDAEIDRLEEELLETRTEIEEIREYVAAREDRLRDLRSASVEARERWQRHLAPIEKLERRLRELERGAWWRRLPVAGLFHPRVRVREVEPSAVAGAGRVDRCVTCHLGAPRAGFEGERWPLAWRSHPRLELFVGETSPHPYRRFGCTVCHGGEGRATAFRRAGHPPASQPPPARPIYPRGLFEAGCVRCHGGRGELEAAPGAAAGSRLIMLAGCSGCHRVSPPSAIGLAKAGPSLDGVAAKLSPGWTWQWLAAPRAFRPSTWMPHFFDLEADDRERQIAEIRAIVVYLWESSRPAVYDEPPPGDADDGRALFDTVGCAACHLAGGNAVRDGSYPGYERLQGPDLGGTGDKVAPSWLYAWLRDPRAYRHDTPMPSLRLGDGEAADLTAYLMTLRDPAADLPEPPPASAEVRDELVLSYLRRGTTVEGSEAQIAGMSERERNVYLGQRSIERYGCHGCHRIPGFEDDGAAGGGDLTALGDRRALRFLEGGHAAVDGAVAAREDRRPLPDYGFSRLESEAVVANLLGRQVASGSRDAGAPRGESRESSLAAAGAVLDRLGCRVCHRLGRHRAGDGPEPPGPALTFEGAKVKAGWLFDYLRDPGSVTLRGWKSARMPTFHWTDAELDAVVRYFAERSGVEIFTGGPPPPSQRDLAVGAAVFRTLQCNRCHPGSEGGIPVPEFAPPYELAHERLRPDWVVDWILDPRRWSPDTQMPSSFVSAPGEQPDATFLAASFATPLFRTDQERLLRVFEDEAELEDYFSDPRRVAAALRDHLWTLGE